MTERPAAGAGNGGNADVMDTPSLPPPPTCPITPDIYARWRASELGQITDRLEDDLIRSALPPLQGARVLDVGCGDGALTLWLHQQGADVAGADISGQMLQASRERFEAARAAIPLHEAPAAQLPFDDNSFDLVTAVTILCFVKDPRFEFAEIARVLRPGGRLVIGELGRRSCWAAWRRLRAWMGNPVWKQAWFRSPAELRSYAEGAGLTVEAVRGAVFYPPLALMARLTAGLDRWLGRHFTTGAAFLVMKALKPSEGTPK